MFFSQNTIAQATRGACSYHGGVNCEAGAGIYGRVVCNDGWINSSVYYSDAEECSIEDSCPIYIRDEDYYKEQQSEIKSKIRKIKAENQERCEDNYNWNEELNDASFQSCTSAVQSSVLMSGGMNMVSTDCSAEREQRTARNQTYKASCLNEMDDTIYQWERLSMCLILDTTDRCAITFRNTHTEEEQCVCDTGFQLTERGCESTTNVLGAVCEQVGGINAQYDPLTDTCTCKDGYIEVAESDGNRCQICPLGSTAVDGKCINKAVVPKQGTPESIPVLSTSKQESLKVAPETLTPPITKASSNSLVKSEDFLVPDSDIIKREEIRKLNSTVAFRSCPSTNCSAVRYFLKGETVHVIGTYTKDEWSLVDIEAKLDVGSKNLQGWVHQSTLTPVVTDQSDHVLPLEAEKYDAITKENINNEYGVWKRFIGWLRSLVWWNES